MKQTTKDKIKESKENNEKKIINLCGYEIWRDPLNFTTIKDGKNRYHSTFLNALLDIRKQMVRNDLAPSETLEIAINRIIKVDETLIRTLSTCLGKLGDTKDLV